MFAVTLGRRLFSSGFAITERKDMDLYLFGFGMGTMLVNKRAYVF